MIATRLNMRKSNASPKWEILQRLLLDTGSRALVFASPDDRLFGIGFDAVNAGGSEGQWEKNYMGEAIEEVRRKAVQMRDPAFPVVFDRPGGRMNVYW